MKKEIFQLLLLHAFLLLTSMLCAQTNYRPGFIITLRGDTIYGEIDYRMNKANAKRCAFRAQNNDTEPTTYQPFEILGFRFTDDGKYYVSKQVELQYGVPKPIFLEYLIQGVKSLYYYETEKDSPIYFVEDNNRLVKIDAPKLSKNQIIGTQFRGQTDRYIPQLQYAFKDCPSLASKIDKAHFNRKELMKITKEYHYAMCTNNEDCIEFEAKEDKRSIQLSITPYAGISLYKIPSGSSIGLYSAPDLSYVAGVTLGINNKRWMSALSGCFDVSFSRITSSARSLREDGVSYTTFKHYGTMLSGKVGIRYTYPKRMIQPFAEAGADISGWINAKMESYGKTERWQDGINPGYYANIGVNIKLSREKKHMICVRAQFKSLRDMMEKVNLINNWSGTVGYTF